MRQFRKGLISNQLPHKSIILKTQHNISYIFVTQISLVLIILLWGFKQLSSGEKKINKLEMYPKYTEAPAMCFE